MVLLLNFPYGPPVRENFYYYMYRSPYGTKTEQGIMSAKQAFAVGKVIRKYLIENPDGVELPGKLGILKVKGIPTPKGREDALKSKKYGKKIYHTNPHTDGFWFLVDLIIDKKGHMNKRGFRYGRHIRFKPGDIIKKMINLKLKEDPYHFRRDHDST